MPVNKERDYMLTQAEHSVRIDVLEKSLDKLSESIEGIRKDLNDGMKSFEKKVTFLTVLLITSATVGDSLVNLLKGIVL